MTSTIAPRGLRLSSRLALRAAAAAGLVFAVLGASPASADVADVIPQDALLVVKANNLQQVNDDFAALAREWALDQMEPTFADPLGAFKQESGMANGINFDGDAAFYFANGDMNGDEPPMVILVPISDYEAFTSNFEDVRKTDGVDTGTFPGTGGGEPAYMADWGDYAAISPIIDLVRSRPEAGIELGGVTADRLDSRDLVLYANFRQLGPMLQAAFDEEGVKDDAFGEFDNEFDGEAPEAIQKYKPVIRAAMEQGFLALESFLRDADAATFAVELDPAAGIQANVIAQFKEDSYLAGVMNEFDGEGGSFTRGLPQGSYLMFGGSATDPEATESLFNDVAGPVLAELENVEGDDEFKTLVTDAVEVIKSTESSSFGLMAPSGPMGGSPLIQQVAIQRGDAEKLMEFSTTVSQRMSAMMSNLAQAAGGDAPEINMTVTENAKTIDGVSFTKFSTEMPAGDPMQAMMMNMVFGPEGQTQYGAVVGDSFVTVSGLSDQQIGQVIASVKGGDDPVANTAGLDVVNENLPDEKSAVFYVNIGEIARTGLGFAQAFGQAPPIEIPEGLPPVGIAVGPEDDALQAGVFISKDLISAMIMTALQVQQAQMGGGGGL